MTFFPVPDKKGPTALNIQDIRMLHMLECQACPLREHKDNTNPNMPAHGSRKPLIYVLGEAPGEEEDEHGQPFVGKSGEVLHEQLTEKPEHQRFRRHIRYNNVVRTRPVDENGNNATPDWHSIECCRPSIVRDIEATKPKAIFGFGNVPLQWITGYSGIFAYRGRRMACRVGSHSCWFYPMVHPSFIARQASGKRRGVVLDDYRDDDDESTPEELHSEDHRMFKFDIARALAEIEGLPEAVVHTPEQALDGIEIITEYTSASLDYIESWLSKVRGVCGLDYETNALRPFAKGAKILTAAVSDGRKTLAFPFDHPGAGWSQRQWVRLADIWSAFLANTPAIKAVHNLQFEMEWTSVFFGSELLRAGKWECTQYQAADLDERYKGSKPGPLSLEFLCLQYFGINVKKLADVERGKLENTPLPHVLQYNGLDSKYHCLLYHEQAKRLKAEGLDYAHQLAIRRVPTLVGSQVVGLPCNQTEVVKLDKKYRDTIAKAEAAIAAHRTVKQFEKKYDHPFNPQKHCVKLFSTMLERTECYIFDKKKAKAERREGTRNPYFMGLSDKLGRTVNRIGCDEAVLKEIGKDHDLAPQIITLRKAQKLHSTYIYPMLATNPKTLVWPDGRLHPLFNMFFTDTSRLSAEDPNVQNYPARNAEAREVRRPIEPPKGHVILAIDYGQIEARVVAMYTKDERYVRYLWEGNDIHGEWAERIAYEIPRRVGGKSNLKDVKVMKAFRTDIKNQWTFPLIFGAECSSAAGYLGVEVEELQPLYDQFWDEYEGIKGWQAELQKFYTENGYVETFTGRRRRGPLSINKVYNSPVQGFTAELVLEGMCRLAETGDPLLHPEVQIHDDLTWMWVPENKVDYVAEKALDILLYPPFDCVNVPITLEMKMGLNWLEMEPIGDFSSNTWGK